MTPLAAEAFRNDPRVAEGRRLLLAALAEHQQALTGIRPADPCRRETYERALRLLEELRGGALYFPYLGSGLGRGPLVELADGSVKYDFICGIGVHHFGHGHPALVAAALDAAVEDAVMQGNLQQNTESVRLAELLVGAARRRGGPLAHVFLTTSGAMAMENALKMALQRRHPADRVLAFEGAFSGRTLALAQVTDKAAYRDGLPEVLSVDRVPFFDPADPAGSLGRARHALDGHLGRHPGRHAAMVFELVLGEGGFYPGNAAFFRPLMERCREAGVAVVADEIQTFGRLTEPFAFQHFGLQDLVDLAAVGKLTQVCATLFTAEYRPRPGLVSQTFTGATAALRAGIAVVEGLLDGDCLGPDGRNARLGGRLAARLADLGRRHPARVRGPFGVGAMVAFTPFDGSEAAAKGVARALFDDGVIAFTAGSEPSRVRFLVPAPAATEADVDAVAEVVEATLERLARTGGAPWSS
ncbi:MAG: aminotransferase class III-fold pyridoxal phosphate-dependent enzyme [Deferrisomatales bacterium]